MTNWIEWKCFIAELNRSWLIDHLEYEDIDRFYFEPFEWNLVLWNKRLYSDSVIKYKVPSLAQLIELFPSWAMLVRSPNGYQIIYDRISSEAKELEDIISPFILYLINRNYKWALKD